MIKLDQLSFVDFHIAQTISPNDRVKVAFEAIDWNPIRKLLAKKGIHKKGAEGYDTIAKLKALLLMPLREATSLRDLAKNLKEKPRLSYLCGFPFGKTPAHNTFSYFIQQLLKDDSMLKIFHILVAQLLAIAKVRSIEIAIDGTHLEALSSDPDARWGFKRKEFSFYGYKVILIVSVKEPVFPITVEVVSGNESETPQFEPLIDQFRRFHPDLRVKKVFGDAAFDSTDNFKTIIKDLKAKPFIAINPRNQKSHNQSNEVYMNQEGKLCCFLGRELEYWGREAKRKRTKYRCPAALGKCECLFSALCNRTPYGRTFYIQDYAEYRKMGIAESQKKRWKKEYAKKRSKIESSNGILKNNRGMKNLYFRRRSKVRFYVLLCCFGEVARKIGWAKWSRQKLKAA